jgi:HlyD family secretion protein
MSPGRRPVRGWRVLAGIAVAAVILTAALWPESTEVDVVAVVRGPLQVTVDEEGETRVRERYVVSAPVTGRLHRIELEPGDQVTRGQTLARLTAAAPALLDARVEAELNASVAASRAALGTARAERERAAAAHARAQSALSRQRELEAAGLVSRDVLEVAETALHTTAETLKAAEFAVTRAEYELSSAQARLRQQGSPGGVSQVVSPIDGVVLKRLRESESVVPLGEPLIEVGNPGHLEIVSDLLSADAVRVRAGQRVMVEQWGGGVTLNGIVRLVEPSGFMKISALGVEEQRVNVIIDFADPAAAGRLGDAFRVEVRIVVWQGDNVLKVPVGALFRHAAGWATFAVDGNRARRRAVAIGHRNDLDAEISGLSEGDQIILHPPDTLEDGSRVTTRTR